MVYDIHTHSYVFTAQVSGTPPLEGFHVQGSACMGLIGLQIIMDMFLTLW